MKPHLIKYTLLLAVLALCAPSSPTHNTFISFADSSRTSSDLADLQPIGCYQDDTAQPNTRILPYVQYEHTDKRPFTLDVCYDICASRGYPYIGVTRNFVDQQYQCFCSNQPPPPHRKIEETQCMIPCPHNNDAAVDDAVNHVCGGPNFAVSVYHSNSINQQAPLLYNNADAHRPLLALVMIVKDEAHTITRTLDSVKDIIDQWWILDTGSTDGTQQKIQEYWSTHQHNYYTAARRKRIGGGLFAQPFVDYSTSRNKILELAASSSAAQSNENEKNKPIFTLMLSADETVKDLFELRQFLESMRYAAGEQHSAYEMMINTGNQRFGTLRIARVDAGWKYCGRVHEYLAAASCKYVEIYRPLDEQTQQTKQFHIIFNPTDTERRMQSQYRIRDLLLKDAVANPTDTRSVFYLARTYSGIGDHVNAYKWYVELTKRSKWEEEIYHGKVLAAVELMQLENTDFKANISDITMRDINADMRTIQSMLLDAYAYDPTNIDAVYTLAAYHAKYSRYPLAYMFAQIAARIPSPPSTRMRVLANVLMRDTAFVYAYEAHRLLGLAAKHMKDWYTCVDSLRRVVAVKGRDEAAETVLDALPMCQLHYLQAGGNLNAIPRYAVDNGAAGKYADGRHSSKIAYSAVQLPALLSSKVSSSKALVADDDVSEERRNTVMYVLLFIGVISTVTSCFSLRKQLSLIAQPRKVKV